MESRTRFQTKETGLWHTQARRSWQRLSGRSSHRPLGRKKNRLKARGFPRRSLTHGRIFHSLASNPSQTPKSMPAPPPGAKHLRERKEKMTDLKKLYQSELPSRAIAVYLYLRGRVNKEGFCWPAVPTMARELKISESTIRRAIRDLVREGFLIIEERQRGNGADSSNRYMLVSR